jgi:hypothetical protein
MGSPSPARQAFPRKYPCTARREPHKASAPVILSPAEAEQLRARLVLVIDQAITPARPWP